MTQSKYSYLRTFAQHFFWNCKVYKTERFIKSNHFRSYKTSSVPVRSMDNVKKYPEIWPTRENDFFYNVMYENKGYANTLAITDQVLENSYTEEEVDEALHKDLSLDTPFDLLLRLKTIMNFNYKRGTSPVSEQSFIKLCDTLVLVIKDLSDASLLILMKILILWQPSERNSMYYSLWKEIDSRCMKRYETWGVKQCILYVDHFYRGGVIPYSKFAWLCIGRLSLKSQKLDAKEFIHVMFLTNVARRMNPLIKLFELECALLRHMDELSLEELSLAAVTFFKTQKTIQNPELLDNFYVKVMCNLKHINPVVLTGYLKMFRYSTPLKMHARMSMLLDKLCECVEELNIMSCAHVAMLGTHILLLQEKLLNKVSQKLVNEIHNARLKDMEKILFSLSLLNHHPKTIPCVFETVKETLRNGSRDEEIKSFPKSFASLVSSLAVLGIYDTECLEKLFSKKLITKPFGYKFKTFNIHPALFFVSSGATLEFPSYTGDTITPEQRRELIEHFARSTPKLSDQRLSVCDRISLEMKSVLEHKFNGDEYVHFSYILPHISRPDVFFCLDDDGNPVKIPKHMKVVAFHDLTPPPHIGRFYCLIFVGKNTAILNTKHYTGNVAAKIRQYKILGYRPLLVYESKWMAITSNQDKIKYLFGLIETYEEKKCDS